MVEGSFTAPLTWRSGVEGESYESLRGPFNLEGKPVLSDPDGPLDTPITGNVRVKVEADTKKAWLVAYMPASELDNETAGTTLDRLAERHRDQGRVELNREDAGNARTSDHRIAPSQVASARRKAAKGSRRHRTITNGTRIPRIARIIATEDHGGVSVGRTATTC